MREFVEKLLALEANPVVTITAALDPTRPGNDADRIRFRNLVAAAQHRIGSVPEQPERQRVLERLNDLVAEVDLGTGARGVVVVAAPDFGEARTLPFPVPDDVSIGQTPATRYLVQGLRRTPRYRILMVSDRPVRLLDAVRDTAVEIVDYGFPMSATIVRRDRRATSGRFALPPGGDDSELWRRFYRQVDAALTEASRDDELPLVLTGVAESVRLFRDVSRNGAAVIGTVAGAYDRLGANAVAKLAWPTMQRELERRRAAAVDELRRAVATEVAVTGMDEVWQLGQLQRGYKLVVEEGYRAEPSVDTGGHLVPPAGTGPDIIDDPVDEIIEHVVRGGGSVEFVVDGALAEFGRIGLLLR